MEMVKDGGKRLVSRKGCLRKRSVLVVKRFVWVGAWFLSGIAVVNCEYMYVCRPVHVDRVGCR